MNANRADAEVGPIGREGFVNTGVAFGDDRSVTRVLVQIAGSAIRIEASRLRRIIENSPAAERLLRCYVHTSRLKSLATTDRRSSTA